MAVLAVGVPEIDCILYPPLGPLGLEDNPPRSRERVYTPREIFGVWSNSDHGPSLVQLVQLVQLIQPVQPAVSETLKTLNFPGSHSFLSDC